MFLEISQNSEENPCAGVSYFNKIAGPGMQLYSKSILFKTLFKRIPFTEHLRAAAA